MKNKVFFSPGKDCLEAILHEMDKARRTIDICVFTISDNRISRKIVECHQRKVKVRIITDDRKTGDRGSDIDYLQKNGLDIRIDRSRHHMHHKFAIIDRKTMLTGSYNWTRSAEAYNEENLVVSSNRKLVKPFIKEFEALWQAMHDYQ